MIAELSIVSILGFVLWQYNWVLWTLFLLPLKFFGLYLYHTKDAVEVLKLKNVLFDKNTVSSVKTNGNHLGWSFSKKGIAFYQEFTQYGFGASTKSEAYFITSQKYGEIIFGNEHKSDENMNDENKLISKNITVYEKKSGCYFDNTYNKRSYKPPFVPTESQQKVIEKIIFLFKDRETSSCSIIISGDQGVGKTWTAIHLATKLNATICRDFDPTLPNQTISSIYNTVDPSEDKPLILIIDEVDYILNKIINCEEITTNNKDYSIQIRSKRTWNEFFDTIDMGFYPYLLIVMTTNCSCEQFDKQDPSLLRDGRIHQRFSMKNKTE
jgi:hypothetical protein